MRRTYALCMAVVICLAWNSMTFAQKGGKPKPVDQRATAWFRCTVNVAVPPWPACGPGSNHSDSIDGDGLGPYIGVGDSATGSGAFLRSDGEFILKLRSGGGRRLYANFAYQAAPPSGSFYRKTFDLAALDSLQFNTNAIDPVTGLLADGGLRSMPIGAGGDARRARLVARCP